MSEIDDGRPARRRRPLLRPVLWGILLLPVAGLSLPYLLIDDEPHRLDEAARSAARGSVVQLASGNTYYEAAGPQEGQPVVLVHGTTIPSFVWDRNFGELAGAGLRVVRYDLYGRGLSDRPDARYDLDLYIEQLAQLLAHLEPDRPVDLVGLSLGGIIVAEFARRHPDRVRRLALISPPGLGSELPTAARLARAPVVGEYIMRVAGTRQLLPSRRMLLHPERHPGFDSTYLPTIRFRGSRRAVLETLRNLPYSGYEAGFRELGALGKPVLLVWGRHDSVVPFSTSGRVREMVRPTGFLAVEDAGHLSNYERPDVVNPALAHFLTR